MERSVKPTAWQPGRLPLIAHLLRRNVKRFRGGLVFKAHRLLYHSTLGLRVIKTKIAHGSDVLAPRTHTLCKVTPVILLGVVSPDFLHGVVSPDFLHGVVSPDFLHGVVSPNTPNGIRRMSRTPPEWNVTSRRRLVLIHPPLRTARASF